MTRAFSLVLLVPLGCVTVQDLGNEKPIAAASASAAPAATTTPPVIAPAPADVCPPSAPNHGDDCALTLGWCSYRVAPAKALASKCACGSDRRWTCLLVRDDVRSELPGAQLTLTTASCMEGAPCAEKTKCSVARERTCVCMSNGRLRCERPIY
jgi:hypothetical protein